MTYRTYHRLSPHLKWPCRPACSAQAMKPCKTCDLIFFGTSRCLHVGLGKMRLVCKKLWLETLIYSITPQHCFNVLKFYRCILGSSKSLVAWFSSCRLTPGSWSCLPTGDKTSLTGLKHMQQKNRTDIFKACLCNGSHKVWLCIEYMKRSRLHDSAWFHMSTITMYITQHTNIST